MTLYTHWRDVPAAAWRWANVSPAEIACRGTGKLLVNEAALDKLQALRNRLGKLLIVRSTYRGPEHNRSVGIMALVAQAEREAISKRTKEALAVARSRGVRLGNPNGAAALRRAGRGAAPLRAAIARNADRHAAGPRAGGRRHPRGRRDEPQGDRGRAQRRGMLTRRGGAGTSRR